MKLTTAFNELAVSLLAVILSPDFKIIFAPPSISSREEPAGTGQFLIK